MAFAVTSGPTVKDNLTDGNTIVLTGVSAGDSIIVVALWNGASVTSLDAVTISGESDATLLTAVGPSNPDSTRARIGYLANVTSGGDKTITFDLSGPTGGSGEAYAIAVSGGNTSDFLDVQGSATGSSTTPTVDLTTTLSGAFIVAIANSNNADPSTGAGYTGITLANQHWYVHGQYLSGAGAAGTKTVSMTTAGSGSWTIASAAFKAADGTGGSSTKPAFYYAQL